jgi:hypothetical protein
VQCLLLRKVKWSKKIIENLQQLFDQKWHWQHRELEEYKFLVRFPPQKQISTTLISDVTNFRLKKEGVLVSLRAWTGDVEPYDTLDEIWVQIRGIPPKWSDWKTFNQIASSLGRMVEVDWNSLFSSFISTMRVKIACKDATKISSKRLFEMQKKMYLIQFKVEKVNADGREVVTMAWRNWITMRQTPRQVPPRSRSRMRTPQLEGSLLVGMVVVARWLQLGLDCSRMRRIWVR